MSTPCRTVIFSNLDSVIIRGVRTLCHALTLSDNPDLGRLAEQRYELVAYGSTCVWRVFDLQLKSSSYEFAAGRARNHGAINTAALLKIHATDSETKESITLIAFNRDLGIGINVNDGTFEGDGWADYCQRTSRHVFESHMVAVEKYPYSINATGAIAGPPRMMREVLERYL